MTSETEVQHKNQYSASSLAAILSVFGGAFAATVAGTWTVRSLIEDSELKAYKSSKDWKVAESIAELRKLSSALEPTVRDRNELEQLRPLPRKVEALEEQLTQVREERDRLAATLRQITPEGKAFTLMEGESTYVIPGVLLVAVVDVLPQLNTCTIRYGSSRESLEIGEATGGTAAGLNFQLALTRINAEGCTLLFRRAEPGASESGKLTSNKSEQRH